MEFDVDLAQETPADDLPNEAKNKVFANLDDIATSDVHNRTTNTFGRVDNDVVIFSHVKSIKLLDLFPGLVQDTLINSIGNAIVDQLRQYQSIFAFIEHFEGVCWERQKMANIWIASKDGINVPCELGSFIFVDCMCDIRRRTLDLNSTTNTTLGNVLRRACSVSLGSVSRTRRFAL